MRKKPTTDDSVNNAVLTLEVSDLSKVRVYELAKELGTSSKKLIKVMEELNVEVKNHMSTLEEETAQRVISVLTGKENGKHPEPEPSVPVTEKKATEKAPEKSDPRPAGEDKMGRKARKSYFHEKEKAEKIKDMMKKEIILEGSVSVRELAVKLQVSPSELLKKLLDLGITSNINSNLDQTAIELLSDEYGINVVYLKDPEEEKLLAFEDQGEEKQVERSPVVAVLGHVDHGKTSLLDYIRKTNTTAQEAGGITQHIGAYKVNVDGRSIVFLDTPGHEAFTSMRARGAQATDIAVIVVAADDGVMPQTIEAINHAKAAGVSIIVAINKIDKAGSNIDRVKQQLADQELIPEEWGGDTICVAVSALKGDGIGDLLDMILLLAEINDYRADVNKPARGVVIEAKIDKGKGPVATVLIQEGILKLSQPFICGSISGKIRAMVNDRGEKLKQAQPSTPVEIIGLTSVPQAGDIFQAVGQEKLARQLADKRTKKMKDISRQTTSYSLDDIFKQIQEGNMKDLNLIIKADVQGSVEALQESLVKLNNEEVNIKIIHSGVGAINESDIMLASASNAVIIGFNVRPDIKSRKMAETVKVDVRLYRVIYEVIEDIGKAITGMLAPQYHEVAQGAAEVRHLFKVSKLGVIAGSYVTEGKINRNSRVRVVRDGKTIYETTIASLKRFRDDAREVSTGYECGILLEGFNDIKEGDTLEAYTMEVEKI